MFESETINDTYNDNLLSTSDKLRIIRPPFVLIFPRAGYPSDEGIPTTNIRSKPKIGISKAFKIESRLENMHLGTIFSKDSRGVECRW